MTLSTFTIGNITIENNYPAIDIVENFYASTTERQTLYTVMPISKGIYTFVGANDWDAFHNDFFANGTFASAQAASEAAFDLAVKTASELENTANELLQTADVLADVAQIEYQDELQAAFVENEHPQFDMVLVYLDGKETSQKIYASAADVAEAQINGIVAMGGNSYFIHKITVWDCFMHPDGNWEVWGAKDVPILKTLVIFLGSKPRTAFEPTADIDYPQECDYRDGGDGWTASAPELLDI